MSTADGTMPPMSVGLIGLAVMGRNLALNIDRNGFPLTVFNRTVARTDKFLANEARGTRIRGISATTTPRGTRPASKTLQSVLGWPLMMLTQRTVVCG